MTATKLFLNASEVVTVAGPAAARRGAGMADAGVRTGLAVAVDGERIAQVGAEASMRSAFPDAEIVDCGGGVLTPGLIDSHTHAVFGAGRFAEHELRATGVPYMEIARRGGGIHSSVRDLRSRSESDLVSLALPRIARIVASGVTTLEIKSGYGLTTDDELKTLRAIRTLRSLVPCRIVATFLGAHEVPLEYRDAPGGRDAYIAELTDVMLPAVAREKLAEFADVFCEPGAYTVAESRRILTAARDHALKLKLHADELAESGGASLAAELGATSADHLGAISTVGVAALAASETVATLLPSTMLFLGRETQAPARALIDAGAAVALATDFNPGTSPLANLGIVMTLGVSRLHMRVAECLVAVTANGAAALGLSAETGQIAPGFSADLALWDVRDHREIPYWFGERLCRASWRGGKACHHEG
ncbi:MAG TPA: imidazolonepropionase [Gemmatimonadaceae bacterium]|nr:imidazolonepropionase [Gemmatimonadaceae bacterium]